MQPPYVHPQALVETSCIGKGTRIWAFTHIMPTVEIGRNCNIGEHCFIESGVIIGDDTTIKNGTMIWKGVHIERGVFLGPGVLFTNDLRPRSPRLAAARQRYRTEDWISPTHVGHGASLGAGSIILAGLEIGRFAMVGAGSVVTRSVTPHALCVGNPAEPIGWVCRCGARLDLDQGRATCQECARTFVLKRQEGPLHEVGSERG